MQTFIVRLFDAEDVDDFVGWIEEPMTGRRLSFQDTEALIASLRSWSGAAETPAPAAAATPDGVGRSNDPSPTGRS